MGEEADDFVEPTANRRIVVTGAQTLGVGEMRRQNQKRFDQRECQRCDHNQRHLPHELAQHAANEKEGRERDNRRDRHNCQRL